MIFRWITPRALVLSMIAAAFGPAALARAGCGTLAGGWRYCVLEGDRSSVLYYLHGKGGDERSGGERRGLNAELRKGWRRGPAPTLVTLTRGPFWLLDERASVSLPAAIAELESSLRLAPRRMLLGESMGGFNAARIVQEHPALFARAALVCPAILAPGGPDAPRRAEALALLERAFPDEDARGRASPLSNGGKLDAQSPPLHVSCGAQDEYGFFSGAEAFVDLARRRGVAVRWQPLAGGHCVADPAALARFLSDA